MNLLISSVTLFLVIDVSQCISKNSVLRLRCKGCVPKPNQCCIGTAVSPNYILTTNYCAQTCQSVERDDEEFLIKEFVIYPNPKTFVIGYSFSGPNTVALIEVEINETNSNSYVNATAENIPSTMGLQVLMPLLDDTPIFRTLLTTTCEKDFDYVDGHYVCTKDENADCDIQQGTPLFLNEQLLGIKGMQDFTCQYSQIRFIAVTPLRYWIQYQLKDNLINKREKQSYFDEKILRFRSRDNAKETLENKATKPTAVICDTTKKEIIKNKLAAKPIFKITSTLARNFENRFGWLASDKPNISNLNYKTKKGINFKVAIKNSKAVCGCSTFAEDNIICTKNNKVRECNEETTSYAPNKILQTNIIREYKNEKIKSSNNQINKLKSSSLIADKTTRADQTTSAISTKYSKSSQIGAKTNAMDWFIQMRNSIIADNSSVLILSTTRIPQGEFVDLT